jgi:hypothetical protein
MSINKARGRGEHPTCQRSICKKQYQPNNDIFGSGGVQQRWNPRRLCIEW